MNHTDKPRDRRATSCVLLCALLAAGGLQMGCSRNAGSDPTQSTQAPAGPMTVDEFKMGTRLGSNGDVATDAVTTSFTTDQKIHVTMRLQNAPAGTQGKVVWKSPAGDAIGEESKQLQPGQDFMNFAADGESLPPGDGYAAELSVNGQVVQTEKFDLR